MAFNRITYSRDGCVFTFPYARLEVSAEPLPGDDGITQIGTRYDFTVSGTIVADTIADFQALEWKMRNALTKYRGAFTVEWSEDGTTWTFYFTFEQDDDWGPKPATLNLVSFAGGLSATYVWRVTVSRKECFSACVADPLGTANVLSVSRAWSHSIGANGLTTRTVRGRLVLASVAAEAAAGRDADYWRNLVAPPLPYSFERTDQQYERSADGRYLDYSVTDTERMWVGQQPIVTPEAQVSIRQQMRGGIATCSLSGRFEAPANYSKNVIFQRVTALLLSRLGGASVDDPSIIWQELSITEEVFQNVLTFAFQWKAVNVDRILQTFGSQPPGSTGTAQMIGPYGGDGTSNSGVKAGVPSAYDACAGGTPGVVGSTGVSVGSATPGVSLGNARTGQPGVSRNNLPRQGGYSQEHMARPFVAYHETLETRVNNHIVTCPSKVAGQPPIVQQTANPTVRIVQCGYLTRIGDITKPPPPAVPLYPKGSSVARLKDTVVQRQNPVPLAAGQAVEWTVHWRYVYDMLTTPATTTELAMKYPKDPRLEDGQNRPIPPFGEIVDRPTG